MFFCLRNFENAEFKLFNDWKGKDIGCLVENGGKEIRLFFEAEIPPLVIPRIV